MNNKTLRWQIPFLTILIIGSILIVRKNQNPPYQTDKGFVFGTFYKIIYQHPNNLRKEIERELEKINHSLSPFNPNSIITQINNNDSTALPDSLFLHVFNLASHISSETKGAFDITVAPLVNAWGFGFKEKCNIDSLTIDSLREFVGMHKVRYNGTNIIKTDQRIMLDCSAIAKGYGCDVVADLFERKGIQNFMIEIGGEVVLKGKNPKNRNWSIGINKPIDDTLATTNELQTILQITDIAIATSGNYRNFYCENGKKYAHTIDPRSGYPVLQNILSATVLAQDCATADAYATSFMVMGIDSALAYCKQHPELMGYFIYTDDNGNYAICYSEELEKYLTPIRNSSEK